MKKYYNYIIISIAVFFMSAGLSAVNTNTERLNQLRTLINYDLDFYTGVTLDSIIAWEKRLEPELEKQKKYDLIFQLKSMAVEAHVIQGNLSLAINNANLMFKKAKELNFPLGTALSLHAIGNSYSVSHNPQAAIASYEEAIKIMQTLPNADNYIKSILCKLIFTKLQAKDLKDIPEKLRLLKSLYIKDSGSKKNYYLPCCYGYYYIITNNLPQALKQLQQLDALSLKYPNMHYDIISTYLYSIYHLQAKEYKLALKGYDELIRKSNSPNSYRYTKLMQRRAEILTLMGEEEEACHTYTYINSYRDSLDAQNYVRQISELYAIYQIDQSEVTNLSKQKNILYWGISIILLILMLIVIFIFRIKRENKRLLLSQLKQEKTKIQAENSIRTKSLFLSNMSHEIRTPLNALSGFSTILTEESIDNDTRQQCNEIIKQNSDLLLKLINDVIDLSSLEIGKMKFNFNENDAVTLCKNVVDMVEKIKQTQANIFFETTLDSLPLVTDSARLQQLLINLLINATKFTSQGSITLKLEKQDESIALVSVTDTGYGIPKEKQDTIFIRFEKLNENAQGTGLGLSICQLIIEQLGGKIWIDPEYTDGARFLFTHPIGNNPQEKEAIE